jgi:hypothetical protein
VDASIVSLVEAADLDGLLRAVNDLCARREWEGLVELAERCEEAIERGKQLWPIAAHIDYRLALEAPAEYAASVVDSEFARFALGPLTEVAASTHAWDELEPHLEVPQTAAFVAQERVLRGEDLTGRSKAHPEILELPLVLQSWEPTYSLATYKADHVEVSEPWEPFTGWTEIAIEPGEVLDEVELVDALLDLVQPWVAESNGAAKAVFIEGSAANAVSQLTLDRARMVQIAGRDAVQRIAWAAASGGAHGRRRGAAYGRFAAWYITAQLSELPWPSDPDTLGERIDSLSWYLWDEGGSEEGWVLRLAIEDREHGWAAAIAATDLLEDEDDG